MGYVIASAEVSFLLYFSYVSSSGNLDYDSHLFIATTQKDQVTEALCWDAIVAISGSMVHV